MYKFKRFYSICINILTIILLGINTCGIFFRIIILEEDDNPDGYTDFSYIQEHYSIDTIEDELLSDIHSLEENNMK